MESVKVERGGQRSHVLVVNDSIIFKFAQTTSDMEELAREPALLRRLRGRLPLPIPQPVYENLDSVTIGTAFIQEALWGMEHDNKEAFERGIAMYV